MRKGTPLGTIKYYPYGDRWESQGDLGTDKLFTGQRLDDTGLYYYGARYYDPTIGRFIRADTIVQNFFNPQALNRFSYVANNPLKYIDPTGHSWWYDDENGWYLEDEDERDEEGDEPDEPGDNEVSLPIGSSKPVIPQEPNPSFPKLALPRETESNYSSHPKFREDTPNVAVGALIFGVGVLATTILVAITVSEIAAGPPGWLTAKFTAQLALFSYLVANQGFQIMTSGERKLPNLPTRPP